MIERRVILPGELNLLDSSIFSINIKRDVETTGVIIKLVFKLMYPRNMYLKIIFRDVLEYSFYWNSSHYFYDVSSYKFIKKNDLFYLSLDPDEQELDRMKSDQDYILSRSVEAFLSKDILFNVLDEIYLQEEI